MNKFCQDYLENVPDIAKAFFVAALVIVVLGAAVELIRLYRTPLPTPQEAPEPDADKDAVPTPLTAPLIDALRQLLESIARGPAWIAMFLAGAGLFYLAGAQYQAVSHTCKANGEMGNSMGQANSANESGTGQNQTATRNSSAGNETAPTGGNQAQPQTNSPR